MAGSRLRNSLLRVVTSPPTLAVFPGNNSKFTPFPVHSLPVSIATVMYNVYRGLAVLYITYFTALQCRTAVDSGDVLCRVRLVNSAQKLAAN